MKFSLIILSVIVATVSAGVVQPLRNPLIKLPKYSIQPHLSGEGRIIGGNFVEPGQIPGQVALRIRVGKFERLCGGALLNRSKVLTAAHCFAEDFDDVAIILGTHDLQHFTNNSKVRSARKKNIVIHELYRRGHIEDDIAIVKFDTPIKFNAYIQPIKLPSKNNISNYENEIARVSGYGTTTTSSASISPQLRYIDSTVMSNEKCNLAYPGSITARMLCIDTEDKKSPCFGDSGGPLTHENTLIGIVSWGSAYCGNGEPAVFTRITSHLDWIEQHSGVANNA